MSEEATAKCQGKVNERVISLSLQPPRERFIESKDSDPGH
jgi:hypothetical protein